ncbi:BTB/POZ domain-containing protein [Aspergillus melleus]|uniref:BTB/POZ domain-containing protein n=1 Tax=Aspergillus melleus TaxID=138277 RepID=UPI001E8C9DBB|nr:uncharacterized protein LDX57_008226 [Aspergillus melleus]KAH8430562.1 hypothetical protein LDX57_008226 [Aspergillus melleus]
MEKSSRDLYKTGECSDLTVTCQGRTFQVHKAIVFPQCPYLAAAYDGRKTVDDTIDLPNEKPEFVALLFQFIYLGNYSDGEYLDELPAVQTMMETDSVDGELLTKDPDTIMSMKLDSKEYLIYAEDVDDSSLADDDTEDPIYEPEEDTDEEPCQSDEPFESDSQYESDSQDGVKLEEEGVCEASSHQGLVTSQVETMDTSNDSDHKLVILSIRKKEKEEENAVSHPKHPLSTSLQMYLLAKKYQIPALLLLAQERFVRSAEVYWTKQDHRVEPLDDTDLEHRLSWKTEWTNPDGFVEVIDDVFTYTEPGDPLRRFLCNIISHDYSMQADIREKFRPLIEKHQDFAVRMLDGMVRYAALNERTMQVHFEDAARQLRCEPEHFEQRFEHIRNVIAQTLTELEEYRSMLGVGSDP